MDTEHGVIDKLLVIDKDGEVIWGTKDLLMRVQIAEDLFFKAVSAKAVEAYRESFVPNLVKTIPANFKLPKLKHNN